MQLNLKSGKKYKRSAPVNKTVIILVSFFLAVTDEWQMKEKVQRKVSRKKNSVGGSVGSEGEVTLLSPSSFLPLFCLPLRHTETKFKISIEIKE